MQKSIEIKTHLLI